MYIYVIYVYVLYKLSNDNIYIYIYIYIYNILNYKIIIISISYIAYKESRTTSFKELPLLSCQITFQKCTTTAEL